MQTVSKLIQANEAEVLSGILQAEAKLMVLLLTTQKARDSLFELQEEA